MAKAAGYIPITSTNYPVVHYLNLAYMNRQDILNPNKVDSLVYATTPYGPVLVAAMFLMPGAGQWADALWMPRAVACPHQPLHE